MNATDIEIDKIISKQEQQQIKELGELLQQQSTLIKKLPSTQFAKEISQQLSLNYGAALCLTFWLDELIKMHTDAPKDKNIYSAKHNKQRTIHLGRLIQIAGSKKGLNFCLLRIPEYAQKDLKAVWDEDGSWEKRRR